MERERTQWLQQADTWIECQYLCQFFRNLNEIIKILYYANHNNYETQMREASLLNQQEGSYKKSL